MNYIEQYYSKIQSGEITADNKIKSVYSELVKRCKDQTGRYIFDKGKAERPIQFIEKFCRHSKGEWAGRPVKLELFQKAFISALYGFIDTETGYRQYKEAFFLVGRKNGKSTLAAGLALYELLADGEPGAECYSIATKKDQAKIIFDEVLHMVQQSPHLKRHLKKRKTDLYSPTTFSKMQALGRNSDSLDGLNASFVVVDELHGIKDRNLYDVMKQSQSARRQPLLLMITTAGTVRESIYDNIYDYACKVVDGTFKDDHFLPVIYELDNAKEWQQPETWEKANPSLGRIKKLSDIQQKVERAKQNAADLPSVLCKDFNIRQNSFRSWLTFEDVNNESAFDLADFKGGYFIGGADLSQTGDLTAATALLMKPGDSNIYISQMYFLPGDLLNDRVEKEKIPYNIWHNAGLVRLCSGNRINYSDVTAWFNELVELHGINPYIIGYDAWSATYWRQEMESEGFNLQPIRQGAKTLSLPMQTLEQDLKAKKIIYNNNPILKWCLTNTAIEVDRNGNITPKKALSPKQRIDGTASLLDAYTVLQENYQDYINLIEG
nr:MAG TPA: Large Terminase [Caudoviricetes sp.]